MGYGIGCCFLIDLCFGQHLMLCQPTFQLRLLEQEFGVLFEVWYLLGRSQAVKVLHGEACKRGGFFHVKYRLGVNQSQLFDAVKPFADCGKFFVTHTNPPLHRYNRGASLSFRGLAQS